VLACTKTVTLVKYTDEGYTTCVFSGVSWFDKVKVKLSDNGLAFANAVQVRIPAGSIAPGVPLPEVGDHLFLGTLPEGETIQRPADLAAHHARKVMAVGDNRRGGRPHVAVVGQ